MDVGELKINRETFDGTRIEILRLGGGIDAHTFDQLENAIQNVFDEQCYAMILDMSEVEYISSAGVGTLVSATHQASQNGGNLVCIQVSDRVLEVLRVLGLVSTLHIVPEMKAALAFF